MSHILIVDDEPFMRRILRAYLSQDHHVVTEAASVGEAKGLLARESFDAVFTDQRLPDGDGLEVLAAVRDAEPGVAVVLLTAFATIELAVESMRRGAFDFITKPFQPEIVRASAKRAGEHTALCRENGQLRETVVRLEGTPSITGSSRAITLVRESIARLGPSNATVLITGETGTGKELVARALHRNSRRSAKPFVAVNCASITESLVESELFGHEKGAFTGADRARSGLFEAAHEGTLFLDEVGELSLAAQAKLLRVLTDGEVMRVGATKTRKVDVRVLSATHRDLSQRVQEGQFRGDLFYRLVVVPITVPPLRDRLEDIKELCDMFCHKAALDLKLPVRRVSAAAITRLQQYDFPGNIRELRNLVERAMILSNGQEIQPEDFPLPLPPLGMDGTQGIAGLSPFEGESATDTINLRMVLEDIERRLIERALAASNGVQAEASRRLQVSRSDLAYKLSKLKVKVKAKAAAG